MLLNPTLHSKFVSATYSVEGLADMKIGETLPEELQAWLRAYQSNAITVLGAENPYGQLSSDEENERRHLNLLKELSQRGLDWYPAVGRSEDWQERHVMILGISRDEALEFKHRYDQAAVLYADREGVVEIL